MTETLIWQRELSSLRPPVDRRLIQLAPWDKHANAEGQRMLGQRLYEEIRRHASELGLSGAITDNPSATR